MSARVIGLTGQTGAGKTTVCRVLSEEGYSIINCDALTREVQAPGSPCVQALAKAFGQGIVLPGGALDRKGLAALAFAEEESLQLLNRTVYPYILQAISERIKQLTQGKTYGIVLDAPTLLESGADALCAVVVAVLAPQALRRARIVARDGLTQGQALARMAAQKEDTFYMRHAQHILYNDGTQAELEEKTRALARALRSEPEKGER